MKLLRIKDIIEPQSLKTGPFGSDLKVSDYLSVGEYKVYTQENIISNNFSIGDKYITNEKYNQLESCSATIGDILVSTRGTLGVFSVIKEESFKKGIIHSSVIKFKAKKNQNNNYLIYQLNNLPEIKAYISSNTSISAIPALYSNDIKNILVYVLSPEEQQKIANFLDIETSKIDKEIELLEKKVELLNEYQQSLIFETVTKGLDKNVKMKDSGIEWIGEIPEHWKVNKFKYCYSKTNSGEVIAKEDWEETGKPLYSCSKKILRTNFKNFPTQKLTKNNDLLFTRNATPYIFIPEESSLYTNVVQKVTIKNKFYRVYLKYMLEVSNKHLISYGDIIPSLNMVMWDSLFILNMPKKEQHQISEYLDEQCSKIEKKKKLVNKKITLLKEYKQSLIYEAVTGKLEIN